MFLYSLNFTCFIRAFIVDFVYSALYGSNF